MAPRVPEHLSETIETLHRSESGRVLATLVRLLGDLDLAEESMHEAFAAALESWTLAGIPDKPRPWLISTARIKAIETMRRRARFDGAQRDLVAHMESRVNDAPLEDEEIEDDRLRLIFICCHPALPSEGQVALTLHEVCGLTTEEIARAFLVTPATLAQRIVRAKALVPRWCSDPVCKRRATNFSEMPVLRTRRLLPVCSILVMSQSTGHRRLPEQDSWPGMTTGRPSLEHNLQLELERPD